MRHGLRSKPLRGEKGGRATAPFFGAEREERGMGASRPVKRSPPITRCR